jgi:hypothetical protein
MVAGDADGAAAAMHAHPLLLSVLYGIHRHGEPR